MLIIGDCHGKFDQYLDLIKGCDHSFQLGDFGFQTAWDALNYHVDPIRHKVGQGNHDPIDILYNYPHFVGRYGQVDIAQQSFFWIGGALSIDMAPRVMEWMRNKCTPASQTWWADEQLTYEEMEDCKEKYLKIKPEIVISHTAPDTIVEKVVPNTEIMESYGWGKHYHDITSGFLRHLWTYHQPKLWIFGHFHRSFDEIHCGTRFKCLAELETYNL